MSCERFRERLAEAAAGAPLPPALTGHLEGCGSCRAELRALRRALALLDEEVGVVLTMEPSPGVLERIRRAEPRQGAAPGRRRRAWPAAAAAMVAVVVALAGRRDSPPLAGTQGFPAPSAKAAEDPTAEPTREAVVVNGGNVTSSGRHVPERNPEGWARPPGSEPLRPFPGAEVLVPPGQDQALLWFVIELQGRAVTPDSLLVRDPWAPPALPEPIDLVPLDMVPLDRSAG